MKRRRYKDIDMSFEAHPMTGDITKKFDANDIKQSINNLIKTDFYSRLNVDIGVDLKNTLFGLDSFITKDYIKTTLLDVLRHEPRADILDVTVNLHEQNKYKIVIAFMAESMPKPIYLSTFLEVVA